MKKVIGGKTYVQVPCKIDDSCDGCAAKSDNDLCEKLHRDDAGNFTPGICAAIKCIFKEQTMSEQNKTALELVDELIEGKDRFVGTDELRDIKAAIEREWDASEAAINGLEQLVKTHTRTIQEMNDRLKSAITMRPITELPDKVPDGCAIVSWDATGPFIWLEGRSDIRSVASHSKTFGFYILPLPKPARRLHPCYMPGCGGSVTAINGVEKTDWRMMCTKCGMLGPIFNTKAKAELEWGYVE